MDVNLPSTGTVVGMKHHSEIAPISYTIHTGTPFLLTLLYNLLNLITKKTYLSRLSWPNTGGRPTTHSTLTVFLPSIYIQLLRPKLRTGM